MGSFENDGSSTKRPRQGVFTPTVKMEDLEQHEQYKKIDSDTSVLFYSLCNFDTCEDVEDFLDKIRTNLFLQDFPSEVGEKTFEGLKRLAEDIDPRYFWVSLRQDSQETVNVFKDIL